MTTAKFRSVYTTNSSFQKIVVLLEGYQKRWCSFCSKKCVLLRMCRWRGFVIKSDGGGWDGRKVTIFLWGGGVRFRASIFDYLSHVYTIPTTAIFSIIAKY